MNINKTLLTIIAAFLILVTIVSCQYEEYEGLTDGEVAASRQALVQTIFLDYFETGTLDKWLEVDPQADTGGPSAHEGDWGCELKENGYIVASIDASSCIHSLGLSYWRRVRGIDSGEFFEAAWSIDQGASWNAVDVVQGPINEEEEGWEHQEHPLSGAEGQADLRLRFLLSAGNSSKETYIDEVVVTCDDEVEPPEWEWLPGTSDISYDGNVEINGDLQLTGSSSLNVDSIEVSSSTVTGDSVVEGAFTVGTAAAPSQMGVYGGTVMAGDQWVMGQSLLSGDSQVQGTLTVGTAAAPSQFGVYGGTVMAGDQWVMGQSLLSGDSQVQGTLTVGTAAAPSQFGVYGSTVMSEDLWVIGETAFTENSQMQADLSVAGALDAASIQTDSADVCGTLKAKEVVVETGWCDFVFEDDYALMSLDEVEGYIESNGHLPGIPSAQEVESKGVSLGESQAMLLMKIEELTLYTIDQGKQIAALQQEIQRIKSHNGSR